MIEDIKKCEFLGLVWIEDVCFPVVKKYGVKIIITPYQYWFTLDNFLNGNKEWEEYRYFVEHRILKIEDGEIVHTRR